MPPQSSRCERARFWASLRVDGELCELESALLDAHVARCSSCRTFVGRSQQIVVALRAARLEQPAPLLLGPRQVPRTGLRALQVVVAAAVVVSAGVLAAVTGPSGSSAAAKPVAMVAGADSPDRLRELRRPVLLAQGHAIPRNRQLPGDAI